MEERTIYDVVIIGSGPGGMTAALYTSRANLKTLILEKGVPGGELLNTSDVENYPGFPTISGPELADNMYKGAMQFGAEYAYGQVSKIELEGDLKVITAGKKTYYAYAVVIATGSYHRKLEVPGEEEYAGMAFHTVRYVMEHSSKIRKSLLSAGETQLWKKERI